MILLTHPTGNANCRALLRGLRDAGQLYRFHTTLAAGEGLSGKLLEKLLPGQAQRRRYEVASKLIATRPLREAVRLLSAKLGWRGLTAHETGWACVDAVYRDLDAAVARVINQLKGNTISGIYGYDDGALASFQAAKKRGIPCLYDLPIPYWRWVREINFEEAEIKPEWSETLGGGLNDSAEKLARKDQELQLADTIFCASSFTRNSLKCVPDGIKAPIYVVPYGAPTLSHVSSVGSKADSGADAKSRPSARKLRLLYVGKLSQLKGLSYLFDAVNQLGSAVELTVVGRRASQNCPALEKELRKHRYIESLPHRGVLDEMAKADLFIFPSLLDGFGLVILEAMSQGVPCITTPNTAAPDFMTDGKDGFIVPIRDVDAIVNKVTFLRENPDALEEMKNQARLTAERQTWLRYQTEMVRVIRSTVLLLQP